MVTKQDGRPSVSPRLLLSSPRTRHPAQHRADPTLRSPGEMVTITDTEAKPSISYYCSNGLNIQNRQIIWLCCSFKTFWLLFSNNISMLVWVITVTVCCSQQLVGVRGGLGCWGAGVDDDSIILQPPAAVTSSNKYLNNAKSSRNVFVDQWIIQALNVELKQKWWCCKLFLATQFLALSVIITLCSWLLVTGSVNDRKVCRVETRAEPRVRRGGNCYVLCH